MSGDRPFDLPPTADEREGLFGGTGMVRVWNLAAGLRGAGGLPTPFDAALACELDPGASVGRHRQQRAAELVIGLEGQGTATVDGTDKPLHPGAVVPLPFGSVLALRNDDPDAPLRYLIIKARPG